MLRHIATADLTMTALIALVVPAIGTLGGDGKKRYAQECDEHKNSLHSKPPKNTVR